MKFKTPTIAAGALVAGLALGGAGIAAAATNGPAAPSGSQDQEPAYTGSVKAPPETATEGADTEASEASEAKTLQSLATTTPKQAKAAAIAVVPGTAGTVELDNENGYVVYSVQVIGAKDKAVDVKVDAGNAKVLAQEADGDNEASDD